MLKVFPWSPEATFKRMAFSKVVITISKLVSREANIAHRIMNHYGYEVKKSDKNELKVNDFVLA